MQDVITVLRAGPRCAAAARQAIRQWTAGCDEACVVDLTLVASALVADSVQESPRGSGIELRFTSFDGTVRIEITDASPTRLITADDARLRSTILRNLADNWGVSFSPTRVWFTAPCQ